MPNKRKDGTVIRSYSVPADLHTEAAEKATREGRTLTDVIREALRQYVTTTSSRP